MKISSLLPIIVMFFFQCNPPDGLEALTDRVASEFAEGQGVFAMAFKDLQTGQEVQIHADELFHAASTMKTPVMIEVYKQAAEGLFKLDDSLLVVNQFFSIVDSSTYSLSQDDDSEKTLYGQVGKKRMIADLLYEMIISSSNLATNIMIGLVDAKNVTSTMRNLGASKISVLRGVEDIKAFEQGLSNHTTARDLMIIYETLALGKVVTPEACQSMIEILKDQQFRDIIPARLPQHIEIAHKTGVITGLHHDSGIVFLPDGRKYILVLLSRELDDFTAGTELLARVSELVYKYMISPR